MAKTARLYRSAGARPLSQRKPESYATRLKLTTNFEATMTNEQREAREHLLELGRYRIHTGTDGWPYIPGLYGRLEWDCGYSVFTAHRRMIPKLLAIPGVSRHQMGDTEARMNLRPDAIRPVLDLIRARRPRAASTGRSAADLALIRPARAAQDLTGAQEATR
jgi:hypothetical protein